MKKKLLLITLLSLVLSACGTKDSLEAGQTAHYEAENFVESSVESSESEISVDKTESNKEVDELESPVTKERVDESCEGEIGEEDHQIIEEEYSGEELGVDDSKEDESPAYGIVYDQDGYVIIPDGEYGAQASTDILKGHIESRDGILYVNGFVGYSDRNNNWEYVCVLPFGEYKIKISPDCWYYSLEETEVYDIDEESFNRCADSLPPNIEIKDGVIIRLGICP